MTLQFGHAYTDPRTLPASSNRAMSTELLAFAPVSVGASLRSADRRCLLAGAVSVGVGEAGEGCACMGLLLCRSVGEVGRGDRASRR
jgi:hypothetical protein